MKNLFAGITTMTLLTLPTVAAFANGEHLEGGRHGMSGWGGMILGPIMMIVAVAAVVALVVVVLRWLGMGGGGSRKTALAILEERFARGEIDKEEFAERRRILGD